MMDLSINRKLCSMGIPYPLAPAIQMGLVPTSTVTIYWSSLFHATILLFSTQSGSAITLGNETDLVALIQLKNHLTSSDPLDPLSSWNSSLHFCNWEGVECSKIHQRVTVLDLHSLNLTGTISPYIANLTFLRIINFQENNFHGEIPPEIGRLFRLQHLNLSYNTLQGRIPANLTHCKKLQLINLNYNDLVGEILVELSSLPNLLRLYLSVNGLTGRIPPSFGNLSSLLALSLGRNSLEGNIPEDLSRITNLRFFQVSQNRLSGSIPPSLYNLSSIYLFVVSSNQLHGILPQEIGLALPHLQTLLLSSNQFTGQIPISLSNASGLVELDFAGNRFSGPVPTSIGRLKGLLVLNVWGNWLKSDLGFLTSLANCTHLLTLALHENNFTGELPNSIANLSTQLSWLTLGANHITGSIPVGIGNLISLTRLGLQQNSLMGKLPDVIGMISRLELFYASGNRLSGQIPFSIGNLTRLSGLDLEANEFEGTITSTLGNCSNLVLLNLSKNKLRGTIPEPVIGLSSLSNYLDLSNNFLIGPLRLEVGRLINLGILDVSENQLSGEIPTTLGNCRSLEQLYMEGNLFQGTIPSSLRSLTAIQVLDLSRNNLSGEIPKYLEEFQILQNLNLSFNNLEGEVLNGGVFRNLTAISVTGNKYLCGGIPELRLPACPIPASDKQGRHLVLRVIIPVISAVLGLILLLCVFSTLCWIRKSRKKPSSIPSMQSRHLKVSYLELFKGTDGFSSSNQIGVGAYGTVYKGILDHGETVVAVKVLNLQQRGASKSFMAECEALRNIRHRNLLKIITSCSSIDFSGNNFKALVFDYMPNGSLEKWLHPEVDGQQQLRNLNLIQRLNIAIDVASALDYLHHHCQTPIVHCDIKPSNILLDDQMISHVGDFGLAKLLSVTSNKFSQDQSSTIAIKGSIGFVAPEYGMGGQVSTEGDIYSYGILLLEMFTGKRPTDDMFKEGLNLHKFVEMALPEQVMEVTDPVLLEEANADVNDYKKCSNMRSKMEECFVSVLRIGLACSADQPRERKEMGDVVDEISVIRDMYLEVGIHVEK
ncbi:uncharacterized protein LOC143851178 [Tasmannia lanceolata]|uniref:uncharacterized protein LOC143851178 n=1 Tax=Tasmannia lanceolata TaxID=3420 RepID=UPI004063807E